MTASAKDLRFYSKELLENVMKGEEVTITYHGKPVAKLVPLKKKKTGQNPANEVFGMWRANEKVRNVEDFVASKRRSRFS